MSTTDFAEQLLEQMNLLAALSEDETNTGPLCGLTKEMRSTATSVLLYDNSEINCEKIRKAFIKQLNLLRRRSKTETSSTGLIVLTREIRELMYKIQDPVYPQRDPG